MLEANRTRCFAALSMTEGAKATLAAFLQKRYNWNR